MSKNRIFLKHNKDVCEKERKSDGDKRMEEREREVRAF